MIKIIVRSEEEKQAFIKLSRMIHDLEAQLLLRRPILKYIPKIDIMNLDEESLEGQFLNQLRHVYLEDSQHYIVVEPEA